MNTEVFYNEEYVSCISDLIEHEEVWSMNNHMQHVDVSCLGHSFYVSYTSYLVCKKLGFDYRSAARGGLLHDFFLYDWHKVSFTKMHTLKHPRTALRNAGKYFILNNLEKEIIRKHMWPLTIIPPVHMEPFVVMMVDKYCACMEVIRFGKKTLVKLFTT